MMTSSALDATRARRYLLGQLPDAESAVLEETYLSDDAAAEEIAAVEDALIEDYLQAQLSADERGQFEQNYLASPGHRVRVEAVRRLSAHTTVVPFEARTHKPSSTSASGTTGSRTGATGATGRVIWRTPWLALAASILIIAGAAWLWVSRVTPSTEMASGPQEPPAATAPARPSDSPQPAATPRVFALTLMPVAVRSASESTVATIPAGTDVLSLRLEQDVDTRRLVASTVVIRTIGGAEVWRGEAKDARGATATSIADVEVPATALPTDDYLLTLFGRDTSGREQDWMQYFLRITHS